MRSAAALLASREAIVKSALARASSRAVCQQIPLFARVAIARVSVRLGISRVVHGVVITTQVDNIVPERN